MPEINKTKILKHRESLVLNYFFHVRSYLICLFIFLLLAFGGLTVFAKFQLSLGLHILFGSLTALSFLFLLLTILNAFNQAITYEELEELIKDDRAAAYSDLFSALAIQNNQSKFVTKPLEIICPEVYPGRKTIVYRFEKKNKKVYYSQTGYTWLFFGEKSLYLYHSTVNHIYGYVGYEIAEEIYYSDIVNVKSEITKQGKIESLTIYLSLTNGEVLSMPLRVRPTMAGGSTHELSDAEKAIIATIREVIRKHK